MNIKDLDLADLKAAYDFSLIDLLEIEEYAKKEGVAVEKIPAYNEVKIVIDKLYNELLNRVRSLN